MQRTLGKFTRLTKVGDMGEIGEEDGGVCFFYVFLFFEMFGILAVMGETKGWIWWLFDRFLFISDM